MAADVQSFIDEVQEKDGVYLGAWRQPVNSAIHVVGSIHDDNTASQLGFRGGTVAGSIHLELFPPVLLRAFGPRWFERGNLSVYFLDPTVDREEVRAVVAMPPAGATDAQVDVWLERPDGRRIGEGTAAVGRPDAVSALSARDLSRFPPGELRILGVTSVGDVFPEVDAEITPEALDARLRVTTDLLPWYEGTSPWGGGLVTPCNEVDLMRFACDAYLQSAQQAPAVPLYGAMEISNVDGPVFAGKKYHSGGTIVALGQSPKTEYIWYDAYLDDLSEKRVAEMRMMYRFMKASSLLYQDDAS